MAGVRDLSLMLLGKHVWRHLTGCDVVGSEMVLRSAQQPSEQCERTSSFSGPGLDMRGAPGRAAWQEGLPLEIQT